MCQECGCDACTALVCPECGGRVILVNGESKCLSCGASPFLDVASWGQEEHRHTPHAEAIAGEAAELLARLRVLLPHWIEHNAEHAHSFSTWAAKARAAGDEHLAVYVEEAARKIEAANRDLEDVMEHVGAAKSDYAHIHHEHSD